MEKTPRTTVRLRTPQSGGRTGATPPTSPQGSTELKRTQGKKQHKKIPVWSKFLMIMGLLFLSLIMGLIIGYSVVGGQPVGEIFSISTWRHILQLVFG